MSDGGKKAYSSRGWINSAMPRTLPCRIYRSVPPTCFISWGKTTKHVKKTQGSNHRRKAVFNRSGKIARWQMRVWGLRLQNHCGQTKGSLDWTIWSTASGNRLFRERAAISRIFSSQCPSLQNARCSTIANVYSLKPATNLLQKE